MSTRIQYAIYRRDIGERWPGGLWEGPGDARAIRAVFKRHYTSKCGHYKEEYHLVKITLESVVREKTP